MKDSAVESWIKGDKELQDIMQEVEELGSGLDENKSDSHLSVVDNSSKEEEKNIKKPDDAKNNKLCTVHNFNLSFNLGGKNVDISVNDSKELVLNCSDIKLTINESDCLVEMNGSIKVNLPNSK